jgi:hypothetical protein
VSRVRYPVGWFVRASWRLRLFIVAAVALCGVLPSLAFGDGGAPGVTPFVTCTQVPTYSGGLTIGGTPSVGSTLSVTNHGSWTNFPGCTFLQFQYQWLRDGSAISGQTSSSYVVQSADQGHGLQVQEKGCNDFDCSGGANSNSVSIPNPPPPSNNPPVTPSENVFPPNNSTVNGRAFGGFRISMKYSDPDGDNGFITYTIRNASNAVVQSGAGGTVISGADSNFLPSSLTSGVYHWTAVATDVKGAPSGTSATQFFTVDQDPPAPSPVTPAGGSTVPTLSPTLTVTSTSDPDGQTPVGYQFSVHATADCSSASLSKSSWQTSVSWTVPSNVLLDSTMYYWCVQAWDFDSKLIFGSDYGTASFTVGLPKLGSQSFWPMWHGGALQVNESTGNLVLSVPGPSFPTAAGTLGVSFVYNLLDVPAGSVFASAKGAWTFADASGAPAKLIDHNGLAGGQKFDSVERVEADGSSVYYGHVAGTDRYTSPAGDLSVLTVIGSGTGRSFQLNDPDGSSFQFGTPDATSGVALLSGAQVLSANGHGRLTYTVESGRVTSIVAAGNSVPDGQPPNWQTIATLSLDWTACSGGIVCITGPDGQPWKYVGTSAGGTSGDLQSVDDGSRTLMQISYDANGRPAAVLGADDLDPSEASPGYATNHSVALSYDGSGRTYRIADTNVHSAIGSALQTRTTEFNYYTSGCNGTAEHGARASHPFARVVQLTGCTTVTSPNQFGLPSPQVARVFYDNLGHPREIDSPLEVSPSNTNYELYAYDNYDTLEWAEDGNGDATPRRRVAARSRSTPVRIRSLSSTTRRPDLSRRSSWSGEAAAAALR